MKIEKINENQIRCTLTKEDLDSHQIRISELAYGTEKAKRLFRDMMQQAQIQFGFEADNIPLMIEAIPVNAESIILIITKVEDPEELDTRFSKFAPSIHEEEDTEYDDTLDSLGVDADNVLNLFKRISENKDAEVVDESPAAGSETETISVPLSRTYSFTDIDSVSKLAHILDGQYDGKNSLYRNTKSDHLVLVVTKSDHSPEEFNKVCNVISEYGTPEKYTPAGEAFFEEHTEIILKDRALQILTEM